MKGADQVCVVFDSYREIPTTKDCVRKSRNVLMGGGGVSRPCASLRAPTPLCQNRVCLTRGVSPGACPQGRTGARRGVASKTPGKCLFSTVYDPFCYLYCNYLPNNGVIGVSIASLI